ncbi:hypothetical protein [Chitinophaga pinensis]|uniref:GntR family transcriptional regulator n=1 Tax=Chitinophaga pinensis TaxID=79329 RepID=A0A5C6LQE4_9BACT|nr:hypothetical protein [Chitinophaga pinensis]TWV95109.1 hypothetical protein FEF09_24875 [Chitinophaga pinensis]
MLDTMLLHIDKASSQAVYAQLANGLIKLIRSGVLKPGTPALYPGNGGRDAYPSRTVVAAYDEMAAQDWIYSKPRSGMVVAENLPDLKPGLSVPVYRQQQTNQPEPLIRNGNIAM